ncbi:MAG: putative Ig domain-containing protein [Pseudomonadota bacterium]|nr:putative Ig domain-containing protein [Pseudomonadota bacterium]
MNSAPAISGTPSVSVVAGAHYGFQPVAVDADDDPLSFLISGKPDWATFAAGTGALSGTPTNAEAGTYANILITVSDGEATRTLGPFSITVIAQPAATGTATLSWTAPAQYTDGTALPADQLAVYRIYHGTSSAALSEIAQVEAASAMSHTIERLAAGTHYFSVTAVTTTGVESAWSEIGSKTIL